MSAALDPEDEQNPIVCFCNEVRLRAIVDALEGGATTLSDLFDTTWAGCGPCGGSCQPDLEAILADWHEETQREAAQRDQTQRDQTQRDQTQRDQPQRDQTQGAQPRGPQSQGTASRREDGQP